MDMFQNILTKQIIGNSKMFPHWSRKPRGVAENRLVAWSRPGASTCACWARGPRGLADSRKFRALSRWRFSRRSTCVMCGGHVGWVIVGDFVGCQSSRWWRSGARLATLAAARRPSLPFVFIRRQGLVLVDAPVLFVEATWFGYQWTRGVAQRPSMSLVLSGVGSRSGPTSCLRASSVWLDWLMSCILPRCWSALWRRCLCDGVIHESGGEDAVTKADTALE